MKPNLKLVPTISLAQQLTEAIADFDAGEFEQTKRKALIIALGKEYIAQQHPEAREFLAPGIDRLRGELRSRAQGEAP